MKHTKINLQSFTEIAMKENFSYKSYEVTRVFDGIWAIDQSFVRSYLVEGTEKSLLIDTCAENDDLFGLVAQLTEKPVMLVHTHSDHDHIAASDQFEERYMHPSEFSLLRANTTATWPVTPIREGAVIELGSRRIQVILLPGHTPGSIALLDIGNRILFSGDSVKGDIVYMFGPGRDLPAYWDSMQRLYAMRDGFDTILACHGPLPLSPDVIPNLIEGAKLLHDGQLAGEDDNSGMPCKLYRYKTAQFYY